MKLLITGSSGFLGRHVRIELERRGHSISGLDIAAPQTSPEFGDILDPLAVERAIAGCDGVIHLAAVARVHEGEADPARCMTVNVDGTASLLQVALGCRPSPFFLFASSREVYGQTPDQPVSEAAPCAPTGAYGRAKLVGEKMLQEAMGQGLRGLILRLTNIYGGVGDYPGRVVPSFVRGALAGTPLRVDGAQRTFDMLYIDDAVEGITRAVDRLADASSPLPPVLNLTTGRGITLGDLAAHIVKLSGSSSTITYADSRDYESQGFVGSPALAARTLGWRPGVDLDQGLSRFVDQARLQQTAPLHTRDSSAAHPPRHPMRILKVIHGYPMRYNAGSEVYSQTLCHALANRGHEVHVFTREEDAFGVDFRMRQETDPDDARVRLHLVNVPRSRDRYRHAGVDERFAELLDDLRPDVVHIGHLNHLSTSLVAEASTRQIPILYTLHDYWLMCPRGQFMQMHPEDPSNLWAACDGQEDKKCAERCYARYFSGAPDESEADTRYWAGWVHRRMAHIREMVERVDHFIAPAHYLLQRYREDSALPAAKSSYLDYGFDRSRLGGRERNPGEAFTFGYIGTHIPAKGIHHLIEAFGRIKGDAQLRIWGRPRGQDTQSLKALAGALPDGKAQWVEWLPEYKNQAIIEDVFNRVDAIVVPSVWAENSPLVIHEAQQARVPVITAAFGGMGEYVKHEVNGLTFAHRDPQAMAAQMQRFVDDPGLARRLGARGYLGDPTGDIPAIEDHVVEIEAHYERLITRRNSARLSPRSGPWRITFDTNPDDCNLKCIMCEEHSPHSPKQAARKASGQAKRRMPIELLRRVLAEGAAMGLKEVIPSTMGEPLLFEHFEEIVDLCAQHGVMLNLTTNGTFPRHGASEWARRLVPHTSDVKISWNGSTAATQEAIMIGTRWERVLQNVKDFIAVRDEHARSGGNRCRVTFQLTFLSTNVDELADIVQLAAELGVDRVKGHHLWAHFDAIRGLSMRRSPEAIAQWNQAVDAARGVAQKHLLPNGERVLLENIFPLDPDAPQDLAPGGRCPFLGQEAWISAQGRFDPCCAPDEQRRTLGDFGSLHTQSLSDIWHGSAYQDLVSSYRTRGLCLSCNMRQPAEVK